ncbi:MAG: ribonuclease E [Proteobacteria bacterium]|nr:ribonuclease E [Pseudomonadota bacterium]
MKRMLINATQPEELRVAMVDGQKLYDLDIEVPSREQKKANIYKGRITRVEPSLEAAFVDYGSDRHGFLPLKEIARSYFRDGAPESGRVNIRDVLKEGQEVVVQVEKEERGNKGAALTTFISLAGRFLVLMPNNPRAGGVSRRIEGEDRDEIRQALAELNIPKGMGAIVRTAGVGRSSEELQWDLDYLVTIWDAIQKASEDMKPPVLIYQESNVIIRALRDYLRSDIGEILIDDPKVFEQATGFMESVMPQNLSKLKIYDDRVPLFTRFQIESQIESAFRREVRLPSGGALVIDHTEALVSIDVNSSRATKGGDIEETALNTNLEAAEEVARQLRLRDMGGLIVIDFIDMSSNRNQRAVEDRLRDALKMDRARIQVGRISRFGLMEMSRQRLRPSLGESSQQVCPRCHGEGRIRSIESLSLSVLRLIEEEAMKEKTARVVAQLPVEAATFLLNEKREGIQRIEQRCRVDVILVPNPNIETPDYEILRQREDEIGSAGTRSASYHMAHADDSASVPAYLSSEAQKMPEEPLVKALAPATPAPPASVRPAATAAQPGLLARLWRFLFGSTETETSKPKSKPRPAPQRSTRGRDDRNRDDDNRRPRRSRRGGARRDEARGDEARGKRTDAQANAPKAKQPPKAPEQKAPEQKDTEQKSAGEQKGNGLVDQAAASGKPGESGQESGRSRSTRRGRRGGRRRRKNTGDQAANAQSGSQNENAQSETSSPQAAERSAPQQPQDERKAAANADNARDSRNDDATVSTRPETRKPIADGASDTPAPTARESKPAPRRRPKPAPATEGHDDSADKAEAVSATREQPAAEKQEPEARGIRPVAIPRAPREATKTESGVPKSQPGEQSAPPAQAAVKPAVETVARPEPPAKAPVEPAAIAAPTPKPQPAAEAQDAPSKPVDAVSTPPVKGPVETSPPAESRAEAKPAPTGGATRAADDILRRIEAIKRANEGMVKVETRLDDGEAKDNPKGSDT